MKLKYTITSLAAATLLLPAAHGQTTGTSQPEKLDDNITVSPDPTTTPHYVKPSPYIASPAPATTAASETSIPSPEPVASVDSVPAPVAQAPEGRHRLVAENDPDANIVTSVPEVPGQLNEGTPLRARLQNRLSTQDTRFGDPFLAEVVEPVTQHGVVLIPVGAQIKGRVAEVHGGKRLTGRASLRLQPESITFPDGKTYRLHADLTSLDNFSDARVNSEGTVVGTDHPKAALAAVGLTTAGAATAGAVIGGGVGAAVGATIGVGAGAIWWLKRDVQQQLPVGTGLIFSLNEPFRVASTSQTAELTH